MIKDFHVYELNENLLSLKTLNITENIKVSNKFYINENEESSVNKFKFILYNGITDIIHYIKLFSNQRKLFTDISGKKNSVIRLKFISNNDINPLPRSRSAKTRSFVFV